MWFSRLFATAGVVSALAFPLASHAGTASMPTLDSLVLLIPGDPGGGWDTTTRAIGEVMAEAGLVGTVTYENVGGANGAVGLAHMIGIGVDGPMTLMLNTTEIVVRSVNGTYDNSYTALTPIAAPIGGGVAFIVHPGSELKTMADLIEARTRLGSEFAIGGGSEPGGIGQVAAMMALAEAEADPSFAYLPFDAAPPAFQALVTGSVQALVTDFAVASPLAAQGAVRILGVTAGPDVALPDDVATFADQGFDNALTTWSGFFAAPGLSAEAQSEVEALFAALYETPEWAVAVEENGWAALGYDSAAFTALLADQDARIRAALETSQTRIDE